MNDNKIAECVSKVMGTLTKGCRICADDPDLHYGYRVMHGKASRIAIEFANSILSAYDREIAEKDKEIERLRELVKELADVAEGFVLCKATDCETICRGDERCLHRRTIALVAKAKEVTNEK